MSIHTPKKMTHDTLAAAVQSELKQAMGSEGGSGSELSSQRSKAMDYYLGEPFGNEIEGRSQVVTTDVSDTIESALPLLLKMFVGSGKALEFEPVGVEDEEAAKQETEYVNHVFFKQNNGVDILYTQFKDALLQKNGTVKIYVDEEVRITKEEYSNLYPEELDILLTDDELEVEDATQIEGEDTINATFKRTRKEKRVRVDNIPPEELLVSKDATNIILDDVSFVAHRTKKTISELIQYGFDRKKLENIGHDSHNNSEEKQSRYHLDDEDPEQDKDSADPSMRKVWVSECYMRVDYDGDGIAELRKIIIAGSVILENKEIDHIPFVSVTPVLLPHKFNGLSYADLTLDLQSQKSALLRNILDNLYLINNSRQAVVDGQVNISDLLMNRPGGVVRQNAPGMIQPLDTKPFSGHAFSMMEYFDTQREVRTGVTRYNQGLDANSLNKTAFGIDKIFEASQQRLELVGRLFGEGVKRMFLLIHKLLIQHIDKEIQIKMNGKWVPISPTEWKDRANMTIHVGLGTGNRDKKLQDLTTLLSVQERMVQGGGLDVTVTPKNIYNTAVKIAEASNEHPELFFQNPDEAQPKPDEPDPQHQLAMAQIQLEQQRLELEMQKVQADIRSREIELELRQQEIQLKGEEVSIKGQKVHNELVIDANRQELSKYEADLKAQTELEKANLRSDVDIEVAELNKQGNVESHDHEHNND